jgi:DNA replication protein DnaC
MSALQQLTPYLKELRLSGMLTGLESRLEQASGEQWGYEEFLTRLLQEEVERRHQKQLDLTLRRGNVASTKTLETFDFSFNPAINRRQVLDLAAGAYLRQHRNVLICGQTGVGKSHLAHALAHEAARQGASVLCTSAHQMLVHINAGRADGTYAKRMATYLRPSLLVIDDFGLKPLPASGPVDFYDVINERYERRSIVLTSNRAPTELPALFGDPLLANATLDRLAHSAVVLTITGRSFRLNGRANQNPKEAPPSPAP